MDNSSSHQLSMREALQPYKDQVVNQLNKFADYIDTEEILINGSQQTQGHKYYLDIEKGKTEQGFKTFTAIIKNAMLTDRNDVDITDFQEVQSRLLKKVETADYVPLQWFHKHAVVKRRSQLISFHLLVVARLNQEHDAIKYNQRILFIGYYTIKGFRQHYDFYNSIPKDVYHLTNEPNSQQERVQALLTNYIQQYVKQAKSQIRMPVAFIQDQVKTIRNLVNFPRANTDHHVQVQLFTEEIFKQIVDAVGFANRKFFILVANVLMKKFQQDSSQQSYQEFFQIIGFKGSLIRFDILTVIKILQKQPRRSIVGYALFISRKTLLEYRRLPHNQWMTVASINGFGRLQAQVSVDAKYYMQTKEPFEPVKILQDRIKRNVFCLWIHQSDRQVKLRVIIDELNKEMMKVTGIHIDYLPQEAVSYLVETNFKNDLKILRGTVGNNGSLYRFDLLFRADTQSVQINKQQNTEKQSFKIICLYFAFIISKKTVLGLQGKFPQNSGMREELRHIAKRIETKLSKQADNFFNVNLDKDVIKKDQYFTDLYKEQRRQRLDAFVTVLEKEMIKMAGMSIDQLSRKAANFLSKAMDKEDKFPQQIKKFSTKRLQNNVLLTFHVWVLQQYLVDQILLRQLKAILSLKMLLVSYALLVTQQPSKIQSLLNNFRLQEQQKQQMIVSMKQPSTKAQNFCLSFDKLITEQQLELLFNNLKALMITWTQISSDQLLFQTAQFITNVQATSAPQETSEHFQTIVRYKDKLIRFDLLVVALKQPNEQQAERFSEGVILIGYALYAGWKDISDLSDNQQKLSHAMRDIRDPDRNQQWDEIQEIQEKMNEALDTEKMFGKNELCHKRQVASQDI